MKATLLLSVGAQRVWWPARSVEVEVTAGHMLNPTEAPAAARFVAGETLLRSRRRQQRAEEGGCPSSAGGQPVRLPSKLGRLAEASLIPASKTVLASDRCGAASSDGKDTLELLSTGRSLLERS